MATAKRLYLYGVSAASLLIGVAGATVLFQILINNLKVGLQYKNGALSTNDDRTLFSLGLGLLVAGLIFWLFHWAIVERMVRGSNEEAATERRSIVRSVYFVGVLGASLAIGASQWISLVAKIFADRFQAPVASAAGASQSAQLVGLVAQSNPATRTGLSITNMLVGDSWTLAIAVAATAVFAYHAWIRNRDLRETDLISGAAAWVSRFYLYGAAFVGLVLAIQAIGAIVDVFAVQWATRPAVFGFDATNFGRDVSAGGKVPKGADWVRPLVYGLAAVLGWGAVWLGHWMYSLRLRDSATLQGAAERTSKVRLAFLALVVLYGVRLVVDNFAFGVGQILAAFLDIKNNEPTWYLVFVLPVMAIPAGVAWWWHRRVALEEEPNGPAGFSASRILLYVTALVGVAAMALGAFRVIQAAIVQYFTKADPDAAKLPVTLGIGAVVVGGAVWYYFWRLAQARRDANLATEVTSGSRTYYLYVVLGAAAVAFTAGLGVFIWRYTRAITGPNQPDLANFAAWAIAALLVAGALLGYHTWVYRRDAATVEGEALRFPMTAPAAPAAEAPKGRGRAAAPKTVTAARQTEKKADRTSRGTPSPSSN